MPSKKSLLYVAIFILLAIAVIPRLDQLILGLKTAKSADLSWIGVAFVALIGTYFGAAIIYKLLAKRPINYLLTVAVQLATSFVNRLLPGGIGGASLNIDYLIKHKHKPAESASVVAMNSFAALTSHVTLLIIALIISQPTYSTLLKGKNLPWWSPLVISLIAFVGLIFVLKHKKLKIKLAKLLKDTWQNLLNYRKKPLSLLFSWIFAGLITMLYVLAFYACAYAVGLQISSVEAFLIYTLGALLGAATMTPGGLGGVEAGLVAGLVAFESDYSLAFSAVIVYRLVTFWIPILPGYLTFWLLQRKKMI